jgi:transposase InsO family protein
MMQLGDDQPFRLLIHDRDSKFGGGFDEVLRSEGVRVIRTPVRAPNANGKAERFIQTLLNEWAYTASTATPPNAQPPYPPSSSATTTDDHTAPSANSRPPQG